MSEEFHLDSTGPCLNNSFVPNSEKQRTPTAYHALTERMAAQELYEKIYCARGECPENRIKEQQLDLFADRTSERLAAAGHQGAHSALFAAGEACAFSTRRPKMTRND